MAPGSEKLAVAVAVPAIWPSTIKKKPVPLVTEATVDSPTLSSLLMLVAAIRVCWLPPDELYCSNTKSPETDIVSPITNFESETSIRK